MSAGLLSDGVAILRRGSCTPRTSCAFQGDKKRQYGLSIQFWFWITAMEPRQAAKSKSESNLPSARRTESKKSEASLPSARRHHSKQKSPSPKRGSVDLPRTARGSVGRAALMMGGGVVGCWWYRVRGVGISRKKKLLRRDFP